MRFYNAYANADGGVAVRAITGTHTALLALDVTGTARVGLCGFVVHRRRISESCGEWIRNRLGELPVPEDELSPWPTPLPFLTTDEEIADARRHPHQTLLISDDTYENIDNFQAEREKEAKEYIYTILPVYCSSTGGGSRPLQVRVRMEKLVGTDGSEIHFNRGTAGSQEFVELMDGKGLGDRVKGPPGWKWLSRGLEEAMLSFLHRATGNGWAIRACIYELQYIPVLLELKAARERGTDVRVVVDLKGTTYSAPKRTVASNGPHLLNSMAIAHAAIQDLCIPRTTPVSSICHHKFILLLQDGQPVSVWTGSTNLTAGGIFGHFNVGHVVTDSDVLNGFLRCWAMLENDPPLRVMVAWNQANHPVPEPLLSPPPPPPPPTPAPIPPSAGTDAAMEALAASMGASHIRDDSLVPATSSPAAAPHSGRTVQLVTMPQGNTRFLEHCAALIRGATSGVFMTAPFGINKEHLLDPLKSSEPKVVPRLLLLESAGQSRATDTTTELRGLPHCSVAVGSALLAKQVKDFAEEPLTGLNEHVLYIHTKFLLVDPLTACPMVVTGSANFSQASCEKHDENVLLIKGDQRTADIYVTEFMRLFLHHEWRCRMDDAYKKLNGPYLYYKQNATGRELLKFEGHKDLMYGRKLTAPEVWALKPVSNVLVAGDGWAAPWFEAKSRQCLLREMFAATEGCRLGQPDGVE